MHNYSLPQSTVSHLCELNMLNRNQSSFHIDMHQTSNINRSYLEGNNVKKDTVIEEDAFQVLALSCTLSGGKYIENDVGGL